MGRGTKRKTIEDKTSDVAFTKKKLSLFNKLTELSILCGADAALIVTSGSGNLHSCGYPSPDAVLERFLSGARIERTRHNETVETLRTRFEASQEALEKKKKRLREIQEAKAASAGTMPFWWEDSTDGMGIEELEQFKASLQDLKMNLVASLMSKEQKVFLNPVQNVSNFSPLLFDDQFAASTGTGNFQAWDAGSNCRSSLVPNVDFGHYY